MAEPQSFLGGRVTVHAGDCREVLQGIDADSMDSCICDPPYHLASIVKRFGKTTLADETKTSQRSRDRSDGHARAATGFMGKVWDGGDVAFRSETWAEVLRVLKPGAHLIAFGGTRTYHRLACAIEDAGFEIRDAIMWHYGSGFPKSHDVSKGIDRAAGVPREVVGPRRLPNGRPHEYNIGFGEGDSFKSKSAACNVTAPATDSARQWEGWGTSLKPATEILVLARKPLSEGTIAANVLKWGCGALNISGTRVHSDTTDSLLRYVKNIVFRVAVEFDDSTFGTTLLPSADGFAGRLGSKLQGEASSLLAVAREYANGGSGQSPLNSVDHCPACRHFCDALAHLARAVGQSPSQLSEYVRKHSHPPTREDARGSAQLDNLLCECIRRLASLDSAHVAGRDSHLEAGALRHVVAEYLESCLRCSGIRSQGLSSSDLARIAVRWLVQQPLETSSLAGNSDEGWPLKTLLLNIIIGPYLITNTSAILIQSIEQKSRWPANVCHDGSEEVLAAFPSEAGSTGGRDKAGGCQFFMNGDRRASAIVRENDSGSAARFFYSAKADASDRIGSRHPTIKPVDLLQYLCRLITPPGGTILDCFAGTGTTGEAAWREGFSAVLIEREAEYLSDIERRMSLCLAGPDERARESIKARLKGKPEDHGPLFEGAAA